MTRKYFLLASIFCVALAWGPSAAHLLELPAKIDLGRAEYLTVQQIYRGWALLGFVVAAELISVAGLTWTTRGKVGFRYAVVALLCVVAAQVVFWTFTFPTNQATDNWTVLPENWLALRRQWEYSHAAGAGLNLLALISLLAATSSMIGKEGT